MGFSVLMSVYIKENPLFLRESMESILNQSVLPNQIVIVKDGPLTNELDASLTEYKQKYNDIIDLVTLDENMGLGNALNQGLKICKYDLVARMDSDDIAVRHRFEKQLEVFYKDMNVSLVGSYIYEFEKSIDNILAIRKVPCLHQEIKRFAKRRNPFNHMTVMFRKEAINQSGNYPSIYGYEDYFLWAKLIMKGNKTCNIPEPLVFARAGTEMYKRRGGLRLFKTELLLQRKFMCIGLINGFELIVNILIRCGARLLPNRIRAFIYVHLLRK